MVPPYFDCAQYERYGYQRLAALAGYILRYIAKEACNSESRTPSWQLDAVRSDLNIYT